MFAGATGERITDKLETLGCALRRHLGPLACRVILTARSLIEDLAIRDIRQHMRVTRLMQIQ